MSRQNPEQLLDCLLVTLREATPSELSEALGETPTAIERATRRLDMRGLIRRRFERGRDSRFIFSITSAGLLYLDPLVQCAAATGDTAHVA
jgi:DNA-binding MarR family transcriptional regulator